MASTANTLAGTGTASAGWINTGNITSSDDQYATVVLSSGNLQSVDLIATNFGFEIPVFAVIDGIVCSVERKAQYEGLFYTQSVYMYRSGSRVGSNQNDIGYWATTDETYVYGDGSNLWGTTWTPAQINDTQTGFGISVNFSTGYGFPETGTAYVDSMSITVYYTLTGLKFGTTSIKDVYLGTTKVTKAQIGNTDLITGEITIP